MGLFLTPKYPYGGSQRNALGGFDTLLPPPPPAANTLATILGMPPVNYRLRNRSEWTARFTHWQRPASDTEEQEIEAKARRVKLALDRHSTFLPTRQWRVVKQGSYHNNTNVRNKSDIDLAVCLTDVFFVDGPPNDVPSLAELNRELIPFSFEDYKSHLVTCLIQEFGSGAVKAGKKAIEIHKDEDDRIHADVVPAFTYQLFGPRNALIRPAPQVGVALVSSDGRRITNFPDQHYMNGCAKNDATRRRYKRVVRILKRLRDHVVENPSATTAMRGHAKDTASFLIESLVYNCPNDFFGHAEIYDDVLAVLAYLSLALENTDINALLPLPLWAFWHEVNGIKSLFGSHQAWRVSQAAEFVRLAQTYMGV